MDTREKVGLGFLVGLFIVFGVLLVLLLRPSDKPSRSPAESVFVQQRITNIQKGQ